MVKKIKIGKVQINFSNRWLYTFIAIGILVVIGAGVYAFTGPNGVGHSAEEIEIDLSSGVDGVAVFNDKIAMGTTNPQSKISVGGVGSSVYAIHSEITGQYSVGVHGVGGRYGVYGESPSGYGGSFRTLNGDRALYVEGGGIKINSEQASVSNPTCNFDNEGLLYFKHSVGPATPIGSSLIICGCESFTPGASCTWHTIKAW